MSQHIACAAIYVFLMIKIQATQLCKHILCENSYPYANGSLTAASASSAHTYIGVSSGLNELQSRIYTTCCYSHQQH